MPGSIYNINGIPEGSPKRSNQLIWQYMMFARRFVQVIGQDLLGFTDALVGRCKNGNDLGSQFGDQFRDRKALTKSHGRAVLGGVRPGEKVHFRRMMSHYWDNFSPFMLDLFGAVIRQGTFVQKMDDIDWLHSPTVTEMTDRLTRKYKVFLDIMHQKPRNMAVPTLDVDLAWQTHQLSPGNHYKYTTTPLLRGTRRFIDHDDKLYRWVTNGGIYSECTCWCCEATRASDLYNRIFNVGPARNARDNADAFHDRPDISSDPEKNPHISARSAFRPTTQAVEDPLIGHLQRIRLHRNYWEGCAPRWEEEPCPFGCEVGQGRRAQLVTVAPVRVVVSAQLIVQEEQEPLVVEEVLPEAEDVEGGGGCGGGGS